MDTAVVVAIVAVLLWALCSAVRQSFSEAASWQAHCLDEFDAQRERELLSATNGDLLEQWWAASDPRNEEEAQKK